jgi:sulfur dioxygenase
MSKFQFLNGKLPKDIMSKIKVRLMYKCCCAQFSVSFGVHELEVRPTPGHTNGCVTFVSHKERLAFTGNDPPGLRFCL